MMVPWWYFAAVSLALATALGVVLMVALLSRDLAHMRCAIRHFCNTLYDLGDVVQKLTEDLREARRVARGGAP